MPTIDHAHRTQDEAAANIADYNLCQQAILSFKCIFIRQNFRLNNLNQKGI